MPQEIYRQRILDHYKHPRHFGPLPKFTHSFGHQNISCGDQLQFQARIMKDKIVDIGFTGSGCAVSMASASLVSDFMIGKSFATLQKLNKKTVEKLLGIPISGARELCALLSVETLKKLERKK